MDYAKSKMLEFNKKLLSEESQNTSKEEDSKEEQTEEQKAKKAEELAQKRAEENLKRIRELEKHFKEAPRYIFNTNVFKKGVKFAESEVTSGEIQKDEALVKELAQFLKEQALTDFVRDLQAVEGVPTDSESLEQAFHAHGLNMRYIGQVYRLVADKELNHLKSLLEKEALVRAAKHLINEQLRDVPDTHLSAVLVHLFNLLLAPFPLLEKLQDGTITYPKNVATETPIVEIPSTNTAATVAERNPENGHAYQSKKKSKKNNKKKEETASQKQSSAAPADLGEILFKQNANNQGAGEILPFTVEGLFLDTSVFKGLLPL